MYPFNNILPHMTVSFGLIYFTYLILRRNQFLGVVWVLQIEVAFFVMAMGALNWLHLSGVDVGVAFGLAGWFFLFAVVATFAVFLTSKAKKM